MEWRIEQFERLPSTSDWIREQAEAGAAEGLVVVAESQTAGRGRQGRQWHSPSGGLYLSLLLRPRIPQPLTSLAAGIAVAELLEAEGATLKWPNDVLIGNRKVAGILVEGRWDKARPAWVSVGIGVNTGLIPVPDDLPATSVAWSRERFLEALLPQLADWLAADHARVLARWRALSQTLGRTVTVRRGESQVTGYAHDLDQQGRLILITEEGPVTVSSGLLT